MVGDGGGRNERIRTTQHIVEYMKRKKMEKKRWMSLNGSGIFFCTKNCQIQWSNGELF